MRVRRSESVRGTNTSLPLRRSAVTPRIDSPLHLPSTPSSGDQLKVVNGARPARADAGPSDNTVQLMSTMLKGVVTGTRNGPPFGNGSLPTDRSVFDDVRLAGEAILASLFVALLAVSPRCRKTSASRSWIPPPEGDTMATAVRVARRGGKEAVREDTVEMTEGRREGRDVRGYRSERFHGGRSRGVASANSGVDSHRMNAAGGARHPPTTRSCHARSTNASRVRSERHWSARSSPDVANSSFRDCSTTRPTQALSMARSCRTRGPERVWSGSWCCRGWVGWQSRGVVREIQDRRDRVVAWVFWGDQLVATDSDGVAPSTTAEKGATG